MLEVRGLCVSYGPISVLSGNDLTVGDGEIVALIGPNGAGKTTTLNAIAGLVPRTGDVLFDGEPLPTAAEEVVTRGVALVPQGRRIFPSLTVQENLVVAARPASKGWDLAAVLTSFPGLAGRQNQTAGSLSGGEQQMLAIGRALMTNPRVLLLDEPSEGLAPAIVHEVGRVLGKLRASGLSILLVEQNTKLALGLADEVVTLNSGRVAYEGPCEKIRHDESFLTQQLGVY